MQELKDTVNGALSDSFVPTPAVFVKRPSVLWSIPRVLHQLVQNFFLTDPMKSIHQICFLTGGRRTLTYANVETMKLRNSLIKCRLDTIGEQILSHSMANSCLTYQTHKTSYNQVLGE